MNTKKVIDKIKKVITFIIDPIYKWLQRPLLEMTIVDIILVLLLTK